MDENYAEDWCKQIQCSDPVGRVDQPSSDLTSGRSDRSTPVAHINGALELVNRKKTNLDLVEWMDFMYAHNTRLTVQRIFYTVHTPIFP